MRSRAPSVDLALDLGTSMSGAVAASKEQRLPSPSDVTPATVMVEECDPRRGDGER